MSELTDWCRKEAARNARMQGDKNQHTNRRRHTFRHRNHMLTAAADHIDELEWAAKPVLELAERIDELETVIHNAVDQMKTGYPEQWDFTELKKYGRKE